MHPDKSNDESELDRLLGQAQWPQPRFEQMARLRDRWRAMVRRRQRRRRYGSLAVAASMLIAFGILIGRNSITEVRVPTITDRAATTSAMKETTPEAAPPQTAAAPPGRAISNAATVKSDPQLTASRDPNDYERLILTQAFSSGRRRGRVEPKLPTPDSTLDQLLAAEALNDLGPKASDNLALLMERVQNDAPRYESLLWEIIAREQGDRRSNAVRLLARIGTARSLPLLVGLTNARATHEAAIFGVGRLASNGELARLASADPDLTTRRTLMTMLLERRGAEAIALYLDLVGRKQTQSEALDALSRMADPPLDVLFGFLESPRKSSRLAAAQALAQLPGPEVANRLGEFVFRDIGRQEAMVALLLSRSEQADRFLERARHDLYLVAAVHAAEYQIHSLTNPSGGNLP
jgi:hypothetical protein